MAAAIRVGRVHQWCPVITGRCRGAQVRGVAAKSILACLGVPSARITNQVTAAFPRTTPDNDDHCRAAAGRRAAEN